MAQLVFASHRAPMVLDGGAPLRTYKLLTGLAQAFETTLVTFACDAASPAGTWSEIELARAFPDVSVVTVPGAFAQAGWAKRRSQLGSLGSTRSWAFGRYAAPAFRRALQDAVRGSGAAIVHFDDLGVALSGPISQTFNVYSSHNIEHRIHEGTADAAVGLRRAFAQIESRRVRQEELRVWRDMDLCLAVSDVDAAVMRAVGAPHVDICLGGTDAVAAHALRTRDDDEPLRILFVGSGNYQPNERGIAWFVEKVFPHVRDGIPAVFEVVGAPPNRPIRTRGVTYTGYVPSLDDFYRRAHVAVVPLFFGSGTRGKIVEAMAYGTPVISTTLGVEGLCVMPGEHYIRADTAAEFAAALAKLAEDLRSPDARLVKMCETARAAAERHFWPNIISSLVDSYRSTLAMRGFATARGLGGSPWRQ